MIDHAFSLTESFSEDIDEGFPKALYDPSERPAQSTNVTDQLHWSI